MPEAQFIKSSANHSQCPPPDKPEYAVLGRSNVGKSSLINMLVQQKNLAQTSGKPGKTRLINHFIINNEWYLADLPGYGFAKASASARADWAAMVQGYLVNRPNLMCLLLLIDARHDMQAVDKDMMEWLTEAGVPFILVFTKGDKMTHNGLQSNIAAYKKTLKKLFSTLPEMIITSSETGMGREALWEFIQKWNPEFVNTGK